jgi:hypothetical protein
VSATKESNDPNKPPDSMPDEIRRNFAAVASATDTPAPGDGMRVPAVNVATSISNLSRTVGMILRSAPIFRFGESISTVDESGRITVMDAERFTSWVEDYLAFTRPAKDAPVIESIGKDTASKIMKADQFRFQLRELKAVSEVSVPVWHGEGEARTVRLAPPGFDESSGLFTVDQVPYQNDMSLDEACRVLCDALKNFPFDPEGETRVPFRRSFSAHLAAMLGFYCQSLFPEGTPTPLFIYNANQPGSGKSLLMRIAISPVHGPPAETGIPENEGEFEKILDSAALARSPYLVLDDCKSIYSQALNRFITSPVHQTRLMHSQRNAKVPKKTIVVATGNALSISEDLDRRAVVVDLFEPGEASKRTFDKAITPGWLFMKSTRAEFLAAMWAFVRHWIEMGMPMLKETKASFEEFSALIGGILLANDGVNPFGPRKSESGGDESGRALNLVIAALVGEYTLEAPPCLSPSDILDRAEAMGLLDVIVGFAKDPKKALGHRMKKLKGRHLLDAERRPFEFGRRELAAGAKYPIRFL